MNLRRIVPQVLESFRPFFINVSEWVSLQRTEAEADQAAWVGRDDRKVVPCDRVDLSGKRKDPFDDLAMEVNRLTLGDGYALASERFLHAQEERLLEQNLPRPERVCRIHDDDFIRPWMVRGKLRSVLAKDLHSGIIQ